MVVTELLKVTASTPVQLKPPLSTKVVLLLLLSNNDWPARLPESVMTIFVTEAVGKELPAPVIVALLVKVILVPLLESVIASLVASKLIVSVPPLREVTAAVVGARVANESKGSKKHLRNIDES